VFLGTACGLIFHANEGGMLIVFVSLVAWQVAKQTRKKDHPQRNRIRRIIARPSGMGFHFLSSCLGQIFFWVAPNKSLALISKQEIKKHFAIRLLATHSNAHTYAQAGCQGS